MLFPTLSTPYFEEINAALDTTPSGNINTIDYYEYEMAQWLKQNTPSDVLIISDPWTQFMLSGLANRKLTVNRRMIYDELGNTKPIFKLDDTQSEIADILLEQNPLRAHEGIMRIRDSYLESAYLHEQMGDKIANGNLPVIIVISGRTCEWLRRGETGDLGVEYPYPFEFFINLGTFSTTPFFKPLHSIDDEIYAFNVNLSLPDEIDVRTFNSISFDGLNDYIEIQNSQSLNISKEITLELWIGEMGDMPVQDPLWRPIIWKMDAYVLYYNEKDRSIGCYFYGLKQSVTWVVERPDLWHHVVVTYDGSQINMFVDGILVKTRINSGVQNLASTSLFLGGSPIFGKYFNGSIAEVRIFNRSLDQYEVRLSAMQRSAIVDEGCVLSMSFITKEVIDATDYENNGVLHR